MTEIVASYIDVTNLALASFLARYREAPERASDLGNATSETGAGEGNRTLTVSLGS